MIWSNTLVIEVELNQKLGFKNCLAIWGEKVNSLIQILIQDGKLISQEYK